MDRFHFLKFHIKLNSQKTAQMDFFAAIELIFSAHTSCESESENSVWQNQFHVQYNLALTVE